MSVTELALSALSDAQAPTAGRCRACDVCGERPARVVVRVGRRPWCGVCAHRLAAARDLAARIAAHKAQAGDR